MENCELIIGVIVLAILATLLSRRERGVTTVIPQRKICCIGDSNTWYPSPGYPDEASQWVTLLSNRREVTVINSGAPGKTSGYMLSNFKTLVLDHKPHICIIEEGGNDSFNKITGDVTMSNIDQMVQLCKANNIVPWIMNCNPQFYSRPYMIARNYTDETKYCLDWENQSYLPTARDLEKTYCETNSIPLIDIYTPFIKSDGTQDTSYYCSENANISGASETHVHLNAAGHLVVFNKIKALLGLG